MLLGPPTDINIKLPFGKVVQMIKILGVVFCLDTETRERLNYKEILSKIKTTLTLVETKGFDFDGNSPIN